MIQDLAKSLVKISDEKYDGCYMIGANLEILKRDNSNYEYEVYTKKSNKKITIIESKAYSEGNLSMVLTIFLMNVNAKNKDKHISKEKDLSEVSLKEFGRVTKDEVYKFSKYTGDINSIHLTDRPIVQGLLILMYLEKYIKEFNKIEVKFLSPLYADSLIYIKESEDTISGYSEDRLCFKAKYENK